MLRRLLSVLLVCVLALADNDIRQRSPLFTDTFEFGNNSGRVIFSKSGKIGLLEKTIKIPIVIPYCMDLTYVRVDVDNKLGPPTVTFDSDVSTVNINYRLLQYSVSSYVITAKGEPAGSSCS